MRLFILLVSQKRAKKASFSWRWKTKSLETWVWCHRAPSTSKLRIRSGVPFFVSVCCLTQLLSIVNLYAVRVLPEQCGCLTSSGNSSIISQLKLYKVYISRKVIEKDFQKMFLKNIIRYLVGHMTWKLPRWPPHISHSTVWLELKSIQMRWKSFFYWMDGFEIE